MWQYRREVKYSPLCKHVKRLKMLKSLCPAVALVLPLFSLPPRSVLSSRLRRFIFTTACCRARPTQKRLPSIATRRLTAAPNHKVLRLPYHRRAYAIIAAPALCRHACFTIMCCIATSTAAEPVLPPNYRRACTSLRHVLLRRVYFLSPRCSLSPRFAVALALSPLHLP